MKKLIGLVFGSAVFVSAVALAQEIPGPEIDPNAAGSGLMDAIAGSEWGLVVGFAVMLAVWIVRVFVWPNVGSKALPWLAIAIATLGTFAVAMVDDPSKWLSAIFAGVQAGLVAAGTWGVLPSKVKEATKKKQESRK